MMSRHVTCKTDRSVQRQRQGSQRSEDEGMIRSARISVMLPVQQYQEKDRQ